MNHQPPIIHQSRFGFTLVEMLIGFALLGTVGLFMISIVSKIYRSRTVSAQVEFMQGATASVIQRLTQDIHDASEITIYEYAGNSQMYLTIPDETGEQEVLYAVEEGVLTRDFESITPDTVRLSTFVAKDLQPIDSIPLLKIHFIIESSHYDIPVVDKTIFLSSRERGREI